MTIKLVMMAVVYCVIVLAARLAPRPEVAPADSV
jgi:hypothetical protein